jgi:response regulator NasT
MSRVLVVAESDDRAAVVREGLRLAGHEFVDTLALELELRPAVERIRPEVVILETHSPDRTLLDRLMTAMGSSPVPLVIFASDDSAETIEYAVQAGAAAYIVDGLEAARVPAILRVAVARFSAMNHLRSELNAAQQKLAERKFVERAKGLLMRARNLSEDEAYHTLRRMAMERNKRMGDVAKSVLEMADLLN